MKDLKDLKKAIILRRAKKLYTKTNDKIKVIWYLNEKFPDKSGKEIIKLVEKIEESV